MLDSMACEVGREGMNLVRRRRCHSLFEPLFEHIYGHPTLEK